MLGSKWILAGACALAVAGVFASSPAKAANNTSVAFGVWAHTSTGGVPASQMQPGQTPFVYSYTIQAGAPLVDHLPINVCLDAETVGGVTTWSDQVVADNPAGDFAADVQVNSSPWTFTQVSGIAGSDPSQPHTDATSGCQSGSIDINVPANTLTTVGINVYTTNVIFHLDNNSAPTGNPKLADSLDKPAHIQIQVTVEAPSAPRISCFMTDSDGNLLTDCNGAEVNASGSENGTFAIVSNKKGTAVSTNPGQLYYNLLWRNDTGSDQVVNVNMVPNGLVPNGAQAVHWLNFPTAGFNGVTPTDFDDVIVGNPAGTSGTINNITVPAGDTLYVTYHLEWNGTGKPAPDCGACGDQANILVSVAGSVSGGFASSPDDCTSGALGYNKQ